MKDKDYMKTHSIKGGLLVNEGDTLTKKQIAEMKLKNQKLYGLRIDFYNNLKPPKVKTKEWLKVLSVD